MTTERRTIRCAIYTRKSSEEGLDQDFNSLDAQFEACIAYIASQKHEGWKAAPIRYDDGGYSGGTLERPALTRLFADIDAGRIDMVVVYKIDRLTRSLMDFTKLVERLDKANCSFVSVTQSFNTSTSMGRLVLNVLLSFAQFEREVTAERIRDKIAASKKKGIWMGGVPPLGYEAKDRQLLINDVEAVTVRRLFALYTEHACIVKTKLAADALGLVSRPPKGKSAGSLFTRGGVYWLLTNPIYIGEIRHKTKSHPGLHPPLIDRETWDNVQTLLISQSGAPRGRRNAASRSLLIGKVFDENGSRLTPSHSGRPGQRRRYYVSRQLVDSSAPASPTTWRVPAVQLEEAVTSVVLERLSQPAAAITLLAKAPDASAVGALQLRLRDLRQQQLTSSVLKFVARVGVRPGALSVELASAPLAEALEIKPAAISAAFLQMEAPFAMRRCGSEARLVLGDAPQPADPRLVKMVARAIGWRQAVLAGKTIAQLSRDESVSERWISSHLPVAYLAPDLVEQILEGRAPKTLTASALRDAEIPMSWDDQRRKFSNAI